MSKPPKEGDAIFIECERYTGDAIVTYVDYPNIHNHHFYPIQVELDEGELHQFDDFNHGQTMMRFNMKEIAGIEKPEQETFMGNEQMDLFDDL